MDSALRGCFVTGTDTGVGKSHVSAGLLHWLGQRGQRAVGYKPVASGLDMAADGQLYNEDVERLRSAGSVPLPATLIGPFQFKEACAPHIAAELEGRSINRAALLRGAQKLSWRADIVVVEGAGGLVIPLGADWDSTQLMSALGLPVVLVVGMRLGCLNHALLTAEAVLARGLLLAGWVGNVIDPGMPHLQRNLETLHHEFVRRHQTPCMGMVPHLADPNAAAVASYFDSNSLQSLFGSE
ncbi:dethiobiotin synthase [Azohydromonas lata]|uniref:ATP-dependent dethiobiotin synthetase BioD n=1 Tax=Azohydromonas lata TaxID=45677 RepID=A0ABU5I9U2_9BURK|nr:dethiobiotin synthase [Azohydromonas lata]MDZ5455867.1 dethiobiotin synthase [Azohydromonas lata]